MKTRLLLLALVFAAGCADEGGTLRAKQIDSRFEVVGGPVAMADVGDFLLENDQIRVAILGAKHSPGPGVFGGSIVDADIRRKDQRFAEGRGRDRFAELFPVANLLVPDPTATEVFVLSDGSDGKEAAIRVRGQGRFLFEAISVLKTFSDILGILFNNVKPDVTFQTDYILRPGDRFVTIRTTLELPVKADLTKCPELDCPGKTDSCAHGPGLDADLCPTCECAESRPMPNYTAPMGLFRAILGDNRGSADAELRGGLAAGDFVFFGNQNDIFAPGMGFDEEKKVFDNIFEGKDTFEAPMEFEFVAASGGDVSYGYFTKPEKDKDPSKVLVPLFTSASTAFLTAGINCLNADTDDADCDQIRVFTYERYFAVGDGDIASVAQIAWKQRGTDTGRVRGHVIWGETAQPVPNARVFVFTNPDPKKAWTSVDELAEANMAVGSDPGLLVTMDADKGLDLVEDGDFASDVPAGDWVVVATDANGTVVSLPIAVKVQKGKTEVVIPALPTPARLAYRVMDETGGLTPAKITLRSLDADGQPLERDGLRRVYMGDSRYGNGIRHTISTTTGIGEALVEPGRYEVMASRGFDRAIHRVEDVTLKSGQLFRFDASIPKEVDTNGWRGGDFHLHALPSFDSGMPLDMRVTTAVVEGLDMAVATDHDVLTDYKPALRELMLESYLGTAIGAEVSTLELGHFIGFPLEYDELKIPDHGNPDWTCRSGGEIMDSLRAVAAPGSDPVVIVAHPRDGTIGYLDQFGVNPYTMNRDTPLVEENNVLMRTMECNWDAMEVFNSKRFDLVRTPSIEEVTDFNRCLARIDASEDEAALDAACPELSDKRLAECKPGERFAVCRHRNRTELAWAISKRILTRTPEEQELVWGFDMTVDAAEKLCDPKGLGDKPLPDERKHLPCVQHVGQIDELFRFFEYGLTPTLVGGSDSHSFQREPGTPRTWFRSDAGSPHTIDADETAATLKKANAFATYGPFIRMSVDGKTFGEVASAKAGGTKKVQLRVETASWFGVERAEVYVSGKLVKVIEKDVDPERIVDIDETVDIELPDHDSWVAVVTMGLDEKHLMRPTILDVPFGELQLPRVAALAFQNLEFFAGIFPPSPPVPDWFPVPAFAITNPIWLDTDGDGKYTAPKGDAPFCSKPCVPVAEGAEPTEEQKTQCPEGQVCLAVEKVCGMDIQTMCEMKDFRPVGMTDGKL
ncbi:MAG: hypothetical protein AMXMBFR64_22880 [Myxococcales bacterium]